MQRNKKTSKLATAITSLYLLALIISVSLMFMTSGDTSMSGIFLVAVSLPWPVLLSQVQKLLSIDSILFNTLFLIVGGLLNTLIIYKFISFITNRKKRS